MSPNKIIYKKESYAIQGAVFEVYKEMGSGFLEAVYQESLEHEFILRDISFVAQPKLMVRYKTKLLHQTYKPDFICFDKIIVEIKSTRKTLDEHKAQLINYIKLTDSELGLLVNFGAYPQVDIMRFINC